MTATFDRAAPLAEGSVQVLVMSVVAQPAVAMAMPMATLATMELPIRDPVFMSGVSLMTLVEWSDFPATWARPPTNQGRRPRGGRFTTNLRIGRTLLREGLIRGPVAGDTEWMATLSRDEPPIGRRRHRRSTDHDRTHAALGNPGVGAPPRATHRRARAAARDGGPGARGDGPGAARYPPPRHEGDRPVGDRRVRPPL